MVGRGSRRYSDENSLSCLKQSQVFLPPTTSDTSCWNHLPVYSFYLTNLQQATIIHISSCLLPLITNLQWPLGRQKASPFLPSICLVERGKLWRNYGSSIHMSSFLKGISFSLLNFHVYIYIFFNF